MFPTPTWLEIDLAAIRHNVHHLTQISARPVMAIVKANAYGHGLVETARAALQGGAAWLGIARLEEALVLRAAAIDAPLLVLGLTLPERAAEAAANRIRLACFDPELARAYSAAVQPAGLTLQVHAKLDTGMGRLGVWPEDGLEFFRQLAGLPGLEVEGAMTHFASADAPQDDTTARQLERFSRLVNTLQEAGLRPPLAHAANSAATLYFPQARFDLVRCGIAIYGLDPSAEAPLPDDFRPALSWKARLASVKMLPAGHGIGYNHRYITARVERIGVCPAGYADGLRRKVNINHVLVGGQRVPVVGGVCMDQCMLQLDGVPGAQPGDEIVLIGSQGEAFIRAEEIADAWGTVNYDVVCGITARVPRIYLEEGAPCRPS
jgi:alanine racemase